MIPTPANVAQLRAAWRAATATPARTTPCFRVAAGKSSTPASPAGASDRKISRAKVYVYGVIGGWDLDAQEFVEAVHGIDATGIDLHINSPGGFVYDGLAMYEALESHPAPVDVHIDGLAASMASVLAMVGSRRRIVRGGRMMIHDAQLLVAGSPADLREYADLGDAVSDDMAGYYAARAGGKPAGWRTAMRATTWYSAQQAVDVNLADEVVGADKEPEDRATQLIRARARVALGGVK